jgi:hypothetical protein
VTAVPDDSDFEHALKNYIGIILGYAELLLEDLPAGDPHRDDVREIQKAALAAAALVSRTGRQSA